MAFLIVTVFFWSLMVNATAFVVSEIYGNSIGRGSDRGKEWFELTNISHASMTIHEMGLAIYTGNKLHFSETVTVLPPLSFEEFVLIAHDEHLGLDRCLDHVPVVVVPGFSIANSGNVTICVALNRDAPVCTTISQKSRRPDGVALFRDPADLHDAPFFAPEPCLLTDGIFATPGMHARACAFNNKRADQIFVACETSDKHDTNITEFLASTEELSRDLIDVNLDNGTISMNFEKHADYLPLIATRCKAPFRGPDLCTVDEHRALNASRSMLLNWRTTSHAEASHLILRDFHGAQRIVTKTKRDVAQNAPAAPSPNITVLWHEQRATIQFALTPHDVPINMWLVNDDETTLHQMATFETSGSFNVVFDKNRPPTKLHFAGIREHGTIALPPPAHEETG